MDARNYLLTQPERCLDTAYYEKTQLRLTNSGQGIKSETPEHNVGILTTQYSVTFSSELSYHVDL
jgi:hypothetical protein